MHTTRTWLAATLTLLLAAGCGADSPRTEAAIADVRLLESPAGPGSAEPHLSTTPDGRLLLSWLEPVDARSAGPTRSTMPGGSRYALRFAALEGDAWSPARTITEGDDFFVNWADFPSLIALPDGRLAAHWLQKEGASTYAYGVRIAQSGDGGESWTEPVVPHRDGTPTEHGFVSLFPDEGGRLGAIWLDGRKYAAGDHGEATDEMTLRYTTIGADGGLGPETVLDSRICDCCQTAVAAAPDGPVAVYRDRSPDEIRDIYTVRRTAEGWSQPAPVHRDGWHIAACPVNGPAIAAGEDRLAVAWFTGAVEGREDMDPAEARERARNPQGRVLAAFSDDGGATFGPPIRVDDGDPAGRVDVEILPGGAALVVWLERGTEAAEVKARVVSPDGGLGPTRAVASSSAARGSGFPQLARMEGNYYFAWTEPGEPGRIRVARADLVN